MNATLKIPLGIDDYRVVSKECYYVDKTLLIKEISSLPDGSVVLFTRPRRFGKSLAISMLSVFFDEQEKNASDYFVGKRIASEPEFCLCGSSPVISLCFKDVHFSTHEELLSQIRALIRREYLRHEELASSSSLDMDDKLYYENVLVGDLPEEELSDAILRLSRMLQRHHKRKAYLLIDEYDTPIQSGYESRCYDKAIAFFRLFYGKALKGNPHLKTAVLTGVLRIAKESLFSGLNNLIVDNGFDSAFPEYFGFSREEAEGLVSYFGAEHSLEELWEWYGGYRFGGTEIMNPWSILSYFRFRKTLKEYWVNTSSVSILTELINDRDFVFSEALGRLLNGERIETRLSFSVSYADLVKNVGQFLGFLIATGYLSVDDGDPKRVLVPNKETAIALREEILGRLDSGEGFTSLRMVKEAIVSGNSEALSALLKRVLLHSFSYFDFNQERSYQAMTLTLISLLFEDCIVKSEVLSGDGRCDIMIRPRHSHSFGAVIEIKHLKTKTSETRLCERAEAALRQIKGKDYAEDLRLLGAKPILAYGIAFYQKRVYIKSETLDS